MCVCVSACVTYSSFTDRRVWLRIGGGIGGMEVGLCHVLLLLLQNVLHIGSMRQREGAKIAHGLRGRCQRIGEQSVEAVGRWPIAVVGDGTTAASVREFVVVQQVLLFLEHAGLTRWQRRWLVGGATSRSAGQRLFHFDKQG